MEALVILIAELVFAPAIAMTGALMELLATVISVLFELLFGLTGFGLRKDNPLVDAQAAGTKPASATRKLLRYLRNVLLILAVFLISGLMLINYVLLDAVTKWAVGRIEQRSGIALTYATFEGDLFKADFKFTGLHARRLNDPYLNFDITAQSVDIDMQALSNPLSAVKLNHVKVTGVTGSIQRVQARDTYRERKSFAVQTLELDNIHLNYADETDSQRPQALDIVIDDWISQPMHSHYALFDMFLRSNAHGTLNGKGFKIDTAGSDAGRTTKWVINAVPVELARNLLGGPFNLMESGSVDITVADQWQLAETPDIKFAWTFNFKNLKANVPADYVGLKRKLAEHIVDYLNTRPPQFDISFSMIMNKEEFTGKSSLAAAGLWKAVLHGLAKQLNLQSGYSEDDIKGTVKKGIDAVKGFLDKRRKGE